MTLWNDFGLDSPPVFAENGQQFLVRHRQRKEIAKLVGLVVPAGIGAEEESRAAELANRLLPGTRAAENRTGLSNRIHSLRFNVHT